MRILVINGPNLNMLGNRNKVIYGSKTLPEIETTMKNLGKRLGADVITFQSNSEGELINFIQSSIARMDGLIINPGALSHYGLALRDALSEIGVPVIEVHLSNIYAREDWRAKSVIAPVAKGQIAGLGWRGYLAALQVLISELKGDNWE
ncbi:MAG: type II 3-dehydroquinate dehydratase [Chloroflexi bacterium]|nr:type II 3-dehydroquinate dehydratase [Chloroflexota bacterium]MBM3182905.1 type II 3-dehydroquinate dehydratase [Chloroflexota bacterium]MBM4452526.1 type II 3-dehydroquinate dehydratase [Chloroflexota bacterium]MBM4453006.1 type II 3-dehydroquinate dehydratase [Chloroflexota bacterium]